MLEVEQSQQLEPHPDLSFPVAEWSWKAGVLLINRRLKGSRRIRIIQLTAGIVALLILVPMLGEGRGTPASSLAKAFIWEPCF